MGTLNNTRLAAAIVFAGICFFLAFGEVHACTCGDFPTPSQAQEQAVKMFSGKVVAVHGGGATHREPTLLSGYILVEFEVYTVWKGPAFATMFIETAWWSGSCGVEFYQGEEWLVVSYDGETAHPCSGTRRLSLAQASLGALGEGQVPVAGTTEPFKQSADRVERFGTQSAKSDETTPATGPLWEAIPEWLGFTLLMVVVIALLGWVLRGTSRKG